MSDDLKTAFAFLEARSAANPVQPFDRISVRDHVITIEIGAFQAERGTTQRIRFNVVVEVGPLTGQIKDDVDRILSYDRITEAINASLSEDRLNLLETLAELVADRILTEPQAQRVFVRIEKLDKGPGNLGVEIVRAKPLDKDLRTLADTPRPIVLFLGNSVVTGPYRDAWITAAEVHDRPVIICVDTPEATPPQVRQHKMVQRRIDLLAIEQNAWVLASYDDRCVVVGTKTELDWAMRNDQISVWAPSKIVLDAVDGPTSQIADMAGFVEWFAIHMHSVKVVFVGAAPSGALASAVEALPERIGL